MKGDGVAILYISHRLNEIFQLGDRVTVLKNGAHVTTDAVSGLNEKSLTRLIIGKDPEAFFPTEAPPTGMEPVLSVRGLSDQILRDVSFDVYAGEILGIAGLAGAGRTNIVEAIFGARRVQAGAISLAGTPLKISHPADAISAGIALITEDRKQTGYMAGFPIWQSVTLPWLKRFTRFGLLRHRRERAMARDVTKRFGQPAEGDPGALAVAVDARRAAR
jgi:ABC-type sugar transport system ATPase subunit